VKKKICVIGSINMDLVTVTPRFPKPGETLEGISFGTFPGGKGANQAVAAARLGADVSMIGRLGNDVFRSQYQDVFRANGVNADGIRVEDDVSTGLAIIEVDSAGENHIIIIAGANGRMSPDVIEREMAILDRCDIVLLQLEIPMETVVRAAEELHERGKIIILDPAPACPLPVELYRYIDFITPNETEVGVLTGLKVHDRQSAERAGRDLCERGVGTAIIKAGRHGAYIVNKLGAMHVPGFAVDVVDTTAAGDSFNAGFAVALARGDEMEAAVRFANATGALSTTGKGAQTAMPDSGAVARLLAQ
jgi:ribokinase